MAWRLAKYYRETWVKLSHSGNKLAGVNALVLSTNGFEEVDRVLGGWNGPLVVLIAVVTQVLQQRSGDGE